MQKRYIKAESAVSLLLGILLFSLLCLVYLDWQSVQHQQSAKIYQKQQALQIIENQIALKLAEKNCESNIVLNQIKFDIRCSGKQIHVLFPAGEVQIESRD